MNIPEIGVLNVSIKDDKSIFHGIEKNLNTITISTIITKMWWLKSSQIMMT